MVGEGARRRRAIVRSCIFYAFIIAMIATAIWHKGSSEADNPCVRDFEHAVRVNPNVFPSDHEEWISRCESGLRQLHEAGK